MKSILKNFKIIKAANGVAAADDTDENTSRIDMSGWDGICFITPIVLAVATGIATVTVEQNDSDSDIGMTALTGAKATKISATANTLLVVDVYKPTKRYVQAAITSSVANVTFGNTIAILYNGKKVPVDVDDTIADSALAISPAEAE